MPYHKCSYPGCPYNKASYHFINDSKYYCTKHKQPGMTNPYNRCLLCNLSFSYTKLCSECKIKYDIYSSLDRFKNELIFRYIRSKYECFLNNEDFNILIHVRNSSESNMTEVTHLIELQSLESKLGHDKILLIVIYFDFNQYFDYAKNNLVASKVRKLEKDLSYIVDEVAKVHTAAFVSGVPPEPARRIICVNCFFSAERLDRSTIKCKKYE